MTGIAAAGAAIIGVAFGWWGLVIAAALVVIAFALVREPISKSAVAVVLIVAAVGAWRSESNAGTTISVDIPGSLEKAAVVSAPVHDGQFQQFVVQADGGSDPQRVGRICVVAGAVPTVQLGDVVQLSGDVQLTGDVPLGIRAFLEAQGCSGSLFAPWVSIVRAEPGIERTIAETRSRISAVLHESAPGDAGVLLSGLVTGDDAAFSKEREEAFQRTGTTHLTAVSGSNLALIAGILAAIGTAALGRHRLAWQIVTIAGVWAYALISGAQPPAVRAAIVATAAITAFRFGRRPDFPTLVMLAAGAMVILEPAQIDRLGFRLSVAASLALAAVLPAMTDREHSFGAGSFLAAATVAQIATLPLLLPVFGAVSLISVPANLLVAPLVVVAMPLAMVAGLMGLVWPPLGEAVAAPAALLARATLGVVDTLGTPTASLQIGIPPTNAAITIALAALGLMFLLSGGLGRGVVANRNLTRSQTAQPLPTTSAAILGREDPAHALATDAKDAVENPAREEN